MLRTRSPDLPAHFPWFNSLPLSLKSLRRRVVLLDFWTYGCINCSHVLEDVQLLEAQYAEQLGWSQEFSYVHWIERILENPPFRLIMGATV